MPTGKHETNGQIPASAFQLLELDSRQTLYVTCVLAVLLLSRAFLIGLVMIKGLIRFHQSDNCACSKEIKVD